MSDPLNPWEEHDRLRPTGDLSEVATQEMEAPRPPEPDTDPEDDPNDLEADNPVEEDTLETLDPENPPA
ncbi:hypothetical protein ABIQ69_13080 [Agromyces sp. G08B096]|uniref:Uncharacterized protein n=1 Tax=Agromyces sp. G08B096 TaxID=3156399 RepID=A0AAU7W5Y0_9MICO